MSEDRYTPEVRAILNQRYADRVAEQAAAGRAFYTLSHDEAMSIVSQVLKEEALKVNTPIPAQPNEKEAK